MPIPPKFYISGSGPYKLTLTDFNGDDAFESVTAFVDIGDATEQARVLEDLLRLSTPIAYPLT